MVRWRHAVVAVRVLVANLGASALQNDVILRDSIIHSDMKVMTTTLPPMTGTPSCASFQMTPTTAISHDNILCSRWLPES
ncbi:hypothetical protein JHK82_036002 [Glycine max]|uniref:Secreted protein n=1 Tax=Glycine max TaxID=3847 RepID=K7LZ61_SOYBN|nr:hypothetical protein JHK85_036734 [Glycine max]KAG4976718.1 hypothetical protein JHK86_036192 [Glycine max]KAG5112733.1 hypothetical protein JHK82_036002 [Glycine max]KAH1101027.1 hypothetical protein GYH30_035909 [Glycine max]KHN45014.1 hypothetical protein glysoja_023586 [Glycine soja]